MTELLCCEIFIMQRQIYLNCMRSCSHILLDCQYQRKYKLLGWCCWCYNSLYVRKWAAITFHSHESAQRPVISDKFHVCSQSRREKSEFNQLFHNNSLWLTLSTQSPFAQTRLITKSISCHVRMKSDKTLFDFCYEWRKMEQRSDSAPSPLNKHQLDTC